MKNTMQKKTAIALLHSLHRVEATLKKELRRGWVTDDESVSDCNTAAMVAFSILEDFTARGIIAGDDAGWLLEEIVKLQTRDF